MTDLQQCIPHKTEEEVPSPPTDSPGGILRLVDGGEVKESHVWSAIVIFLWRMGGCEGEEGEEVYESEGM